MSLQRNYTGMSAKQDGQVGDDALIVEQGNLFRGKILASWEEGLKEMVDSKADVELDTGKVNYSVGVNRQTELKKSTWKRVLPMIQLDTRQFESVGIKRKDLEAESVQERADETGVVDMKRLKYDEQNINADGGDEIMRVDGYQLDKKRMEKVRKSCGLINGIEVGAEGTRGGLCLAWKDDIDVTLRSFSNWHLDVLVKEEGIQEEWQFTGLYGSSYLRDHNLVWNLLRRLSQEGNFPWMVAGDFNEIMYSFEKKKGIPRDHKRMEIFREALEECNLMDIGYSGVWYTWERGNLPETNIRERLDRGLLMKNGEICSLWVVFIIFPMPHQIIALY
ncbi:Exo_endo_phos domain-containing protein [Gossypium australe]|uniref:Exo_endo_phos domain-containing protein n=1 Tax=Gossypium australe TaxID=47621 RepID=A0A5B6WFJ8_9ROSI|nr:Exo_endo_phos domain-containing protein [Gossypium australe]